jgi:putative ABC transport system permease protein
MIRFLMRGLIRDRHRSLYPVIVVVLGVAIISFAYSYMSGFMNDAIQANAIFDTGHVKVMTRAYAEISNQVPNDLALTEVETFKHELRQDYPQFDWVARIKYGGLLDFPDEVGETRAQGPVFGLAFDLLSEKSSELERLNLANAVIRGRLPQSPGEMVISDEFARSLDVQVGDVGTLVGATAKGSMAVFNFKLVGTVRFGVGPLDHSTMLADLSDIQYVLDMEDGAGEVLGFFSSELYDDEAARSAADEFNSASSMIEGEFEPVMLTLADQNNLGGLIDTVELRVYIMVGIFLFVMSAVLWNAGLMSGIRRYREMGIRLAMGESKGHVYRTLLGESVIIGLVGSILGSALGLAFGYYLQEVGLDFSSFMEGSRMLMSSIMHAQVTPVSYYIGFIPGLAATIFGAAISGIGLFKRPTSQLFKELEE